MADLSHKITDLVRFFTFYVLVNAITNKSFSCILLKFVVHVDNDQFLDIFKNCLEKNQNGKFITQNDLFIAILHKQQIFFPGLKNYILR